MIKQTRLNRRIRIAAALSGVVVAAAAVTLVSSAATSAATLRALKARSASMSRIAAKAPAMPAVLAYNRDIRPILAENCFACHGPDSASRKAGLRLDRPADATALLNGVAPIVPGKPDSSEVIKRVMGQTSIMPPEGHTALTKDQISVLRRWIAQGAKYEKHWAYIPPVKPALPAVKNAAWVKNPIDRFILARLDHEGLTPAPEADRRTLARRVSLDLTGLPPSPADLSTYLADKSPTAYEKLVDRLMATPQWGEHRARYWLDAARYADSNGIHIDNYREMWSYRDWVISAYNRNEPFDQFTIDQLAGDLVPNPTIDQRVATGFVRCNITTSEGGAIDEEYRVLYARDRVETTSAVFLGSTLNCSVCHDHKFDPFTQRDFYSMSAYFNNTTEPAMDGNVANTPPVMLVVPEADRARYDSVKTDLAAAKKDVDARKLAARADFEQWLTHADSTTLAQAIPSDGLRFHAGLAEGQGRTVNAVFDGRPMALTVTSNPGWKAGAVSALAFQRMAGSSIDAPMVGDYEKDQKFATSVWVNIPVATTGGAIVSRMDDQHDYRGWDVWLENGKVGTHIISKWPDDALKVVSRNPLSPGKWHHVVVSYDGGAAASSVKIFVDGTQQEMDIQANALKGSIKTTVPFKIGQRFSTSGIDGAGIQDVRLYGRALTQTDAQNIMQGTRAVWLLSNGAAKLTTADRDDLYNTWLNGSDAKYKDLAAKVAALTSEQQAIMSRATEAHVMQDKPTKAVAYILYRGDYDKRRDEVGPATPAYLPPMPADFPNNRLGLAKWLLLPENPLTARVTVNRYWQEVFGQGLVRTTSDFGVNGELPSHPELLDWLAVDFRDHGWDIKRLFKQMVMSATYRQSALETPEKTRKDPTNRLLAHGPRFRMDAEMVRDYALAASGLLVRKIGGPSVKPYQPDGVWEAVAMPGSNTHDYKRDTGDGLYRRSMYTFWKRSAPPASLDVFNAPTRESCTVRRERTDTPLQALVTLNDVQYVEAARVLAQHALLEGGATNKSRIDYIAQRLVARSFNPKEEAVVEKSLADLSSFYRNNLPDAKQLVMVGDMKADPTIPAERLAAWTMLVNQLMNLDEVLNK